MGFPWTIERLYVQTVKVSAEKLTGTNQKGVREEPYFKIPVARVIWPILHTLIGIGNKILKYFVDIVDNDIEIKSPKKYVSESTLEILMRKCRMQ